MNDQSLQQTSNPDRAAGLSSPLEIRVENLYKSFGGRQVLDGINLEAHRGEMIALVGGSGGGKTTLMRHMIGLEHPDTGRVLVADHESASSHLVDLSTLNPEGMERLERHWAVVFQGNALLSGMTVAYNVALPLREVQRLDESAVRTRIDEVLREVALDPTTDLNLTPDQLSGGMAKRVAIARALVQDPILLFYDEPTTGLDPQVSEQIQDLIGSVQHRKTASGFARTSFLITHDKDMLFRLRPRIVMLDAGRIVFDGAYEAFQNSDSAITRPYFDLMPTLQKGRDGSVRQPAQQLAPKSAASP